MRCAGSRSASLTTIALDTNVLLPLFNGTLLSSKDVAEAVRRAVERGDELATPVFCAGEFWRVCTEPRGMGASPATVGRFLSRWLRAAPLLNPREGYWSVLRELMVQAQPRGGMIFDCQIAAVAIEHGVEEIWTFDKRFPRDPRLKVLDPLNP